MKRASRLLATLKEPGLNEQSVVIFTRDNGGFYPNNNAPLRANKGACYEGGRRRPTSFPNMLRRRA